MWISKVKAKQDVNQCEYVRPALSIGPMNPYYVVNEIIYFLLT